MNIWVNGCFDVLHIGHLNLLQGAKYYKDPRYSKKGDKNKLIVGIDSDKRVKELKGTGRPINTEKDRKRMLEALKIVDKVVVFNTSEELRNHIKTWDIDFMMIGDQYRNKNVIGSENSKHGVVFYPVDEHSTTDIIKKIKERC